MTPLFTHSNKKSISSRPSPRLQWLRTHTQITTATTAVYSANSFPPGKSHFSERYYCIYLKFGSHFNWSPIACREGSTHARTQFCHRPSAFLLHPLHSCSLRVSNFQKVKTSGGLAQSYVFYSYSFKLIAGQPSCSLLWFPLACSTAISHLDERGIAMLFFISFHILEIVTYEQTPKVPRRG